MTDRPAPLVLVVADHPDTAASTAEGCRLSGFPARHATSGDEALALAADARPDVVLLDVRMPGMDGCELARRRARLPRKPPLLVAVTGRVTERDRARTAAAGCHMHLAKPVHPGTLAGLLRRVAECQAIAGR